MIMIDHLAGFSKGDAVTVRNEGNREYTVVGFWSRNGVPTARCITWDIVPGEVIEAERDVRFRLLQHAQ